MAQQEHANGAANEGATLVGVVHAFNVEGLAGWMRAHVDGFMGTAADLAGMAVFLATKEADYIVAQTFGVDGGNWMA